MTAKLRSGWQKIEQHPFIAAGIIIAFLALIVLIIAVVISNGTGFNGYTVKSTATETTLSRQTKVTTTAQSQPGKTLWDLLQLLAVLAIPVVVGFGGAWFTAQQGKVSERENKDNQREKALQDYIDKMSDLLLKERLRESVPDLKQVLQIRSGNSQIHLELKPEYEEVRTIARVRTLTILPRLDADRKRSVLQFLYESGLIKKDKCIIDLSGADLRGVDLSYAKLRESDLSGVNLSHAILRETELYNSKLSHAILYEADLSGVGLIGADLTYADLSHAKLHGVVLTGTNLIVAKLNGADLSRAIFSAFTLFKDNPEPAAMLNGTELIGTDLSYADLSGVNLNAARLDTAILVGANLTGANLLAVWMRGANLQGARVTTEQLDQAQWLNGTIMPNGRKHP